MNNEEAEKKTFSVETNPYLIGIRWGVCGVLEANYSEKYETNYMCTAARFWELGQGSLRGQNIIYHLKSNEIFVLFWWKVQQKFRNHIQPCCVGGWKKFCLTSFHTIFLLLQTNKTLMNRQFCLNIVLKQKKIWETFRLKSNNLKRKNNAINMKK